MKSEIIYNQLGGIRFVAMVGAKRIYFTNNQLRFAIGKNNSGANYVTITLNGKDLYDINFSKYTMKNYGCVVKSEFTDVYAEQLTKVFESVTGLYTSL